MQSDYDSIQLIPRGISTVAHRGDVDLRSDLYGLYPIMSSPMRGISGSKLVVEMAKNNCLGILHRFGTWEERYTRLLEVSRHSIPFGVAIGFGKTDFDFNEEIKFLQHSVLNGAILAVLDVANGYIPQHSEKGKILRDEFPDLALMSGNVITREGAQYLYDSGFDYVRVGIGHGANCTTRRQTGVGRNQLRAIQDCFPADALIVADGGIDEAGKAVKSFACGADFVMLGRLLAESFEAEHDGEIDGMASRKNMIANGIEIKSVEGKSTKVEKTAPLKEILTEFLWNIRSACTYLNSPTHHDLPYFSEIIRNSYDE